MKRILLTTTSLVLAAGVAQADITFSGSTGIALIDDNGASVAGHRLQLTLQLHQAAVEASISRRSKVTTAAARRLQQQILCCRVRHALSLLPQLAQAWRQLQQLSDR